LAGIVLVRLLHKTPPAAHRNIDSTLNEGQVVEFELVTNRGKTSAENLKVA
jgi:cold shock CspA family protein